MSELKIGDKVRVLFLKIRKSEGESYTLYGSDNAFYGHDGEIMTIGEYEGEKTYNVVFHDLPGYGDFIEEELEKVE